VDSPVAPISPTERCPHCGRYNNRGLAIDIVIIKDDKILLGKRGGTDEPFMGYWALFGGFVEWGESVEEALVRECKEESNMVVTSHKLLGIYSKPSRHIRQVVTAAYAVEAEGEPKAGDDIVEVKWYHLNAMPAQLAFDHAIIVADYLKTG
jgi:ADP-ribose pyrophosphatase YjhB (NUDIX family)